ncbi:AbrB family transcriptional regulator [Propionivibrio soli]|uniref:AbrB family transcriptional regulator n=1 Tax=Propionivibrio soli TaxID=2976531 RepID=UPI0021E8A539|nr:AbrB family transcriptional regulator [Propionivibrio soli]
MEHKDNKPARAPLEGRPAVTLWSLLLVLSLVFAGLLDLIHLPAALLLGAMFAAILVALGGGAPQITRKAFIIAQGIVGCLVARSMTPASLASLHDDWVLFVSVTLVVILLCAGMGWVLAKKQVLPGATAVWGSSPGGAAIMTFMSDAHGADMRLVAIMQYLRVVMVTVIATVISRLWIGPTGATTPGIYDNLLATVPWDQLLYTLAIAVSASLIAQRFKLPGGGILLPLIVASAAQISGLVTIVLPPWILAPTYAVLGWSIGLRFNRQALSQAAKALPSMIVSIFCLIGVCAAIAVALTLLAGVDPLTAYLATSPGGLDSVAIIATASDVNVPFVMAFQTARLVMVVFTGPALARFITDRL